MKPESTTATLRRVSDTEEIERLRAHRAAGERAAAQLDMAGNVQEWCFDAWEENAYVRYAKGDLRVPQTGEYRVNRSGRWGQNNNAQTCTTTRRTADSRKTAYVNLGFRAAR